MKAVLVTSYVGTALGLLLLAVPVGAGPRAALVFMAAACLLRARHWWRHA